MSNSNLSNHKPSFNASQPTGCIPEQLIAAYIERVLKHITLELLDDGTWFAMTPLITDVWGAGTNSAAAEADLREVLEEWIFMTLSDYNSEVPVIDGMDLNVIRLASSPGQ
jgi:predicted RNase H-like HicB family nuclease